ncbi:MAG: glutamine amidotransferase [Rhodoferax sp.]|nr:glutamine amidotransferase [Actinomycetota bacterium]
MNVLRIAVVYPELLGTYGDGGNALVLERRLAWRGMDVEMVEVLLGTPVPEQCDLYVIGGGEDSAQLQALAELRRGTGLQSAIGRGAPVLAVCAGLQILGASLTDREGVVHAGLDLVDATTTRLDRRAVGEVVAVPRAELGLPTLLGFENHAGATRLGPAALPLAAVDQGVGNGDGEPRGEGLVQGSVIATYLHGPVLARNPALADLLLSRACGRTLSDLADPHEAAARAAMQSRLSRGRRRTVSTAPLG